MTGEYPRLGITSPRSRKDTARAAAVRGKFTNFFFPVKLEADDLFKGGVAKR